MPALRRSSPSSFLNLPFLILLLSIFAFLLFFLAIFPSSSPSKLRPTITVKKSWDSLNVFLVLFAILCGVFARKNDDDLPLSGDDTTANNHNVSKEDETHTASSNWFDQFSNTDTPASGSLRRLKRSSSSYPDLRQESLWDSENDRYRFFDDFEIRKYRSPSASSEYVYHRKQRSVLQESNFKEIPVDTYVIRSSPPSPVIPPPSPVPTPPPPPPPPPPATSHGRHRRTYTTIARKEKVENAGENDHEFTEMKDRPSMPPPPPPPPPRPPPIMKGTRSERSHWKSERKKINNATKELKMVFISLYHQSKRKKKQKTKCLYDDLLHSQHELQSFTVPPPPPPPPPPPSVFQSFFRKGNKNKRVYSYSAPPPPPPPPPRPLLSSSKRWSKRKNYAPPPAPPPPPPAPSTPPQVYSRRRNSTTAGRPPLPTRVNNMHEENVNNGGQSPLIPMPPPPPPPPFRVPGFKFRVQGDYVKIRSAHSSRCSSPELDELDKRSTETVNMMDGGDGIGGPVFCPSPDVNTKADTFIARLRGEWRLEKINSIKEKRSMGLDMALSPGPSTV